MTMKFPVVIRTLLLVEALMTSVRADDFEEAREAINEVAPNISYTNFCSTIASGEDKIACRIQTVPTVGFLVCQQPTLDGIPCSDILTIELNEIVQVAEGGVRTVTVNQEQINNVKCGVADSLDCSGFLELWVTDGLFQQIRDHIVQGTVEELINQVRDFTEEDKWPLTANDLNTIIGYMNVNPDQNNYRQICDLQGFFLQNGGFLVNDVPSVEENISLNHRCYDNDSEPTTQEVLTALRRIIEALGTDEVVTTMSTDSGQKNSVMITLCVVLYLGILILT